MASTVSPVAQRVSSPVTAKIPKPRNLTNLFTQTVHGQHLGAAGLTPTTPLNFVSSPKMSPTPRKGSSKKPTLSSSIKRRRSQSVGPKPIKPSKIPVSRVPPITAAKMYVLEAEEAALLRSLANVRQKLTELRGHRRPATVINQRLNQLSQEELEQGIHFGRRSPVKPRTSSMIS